MSCDRRTFMKSGLAGAASLAASACTTTPPGASEAAESEASASVQDAAPPETGDEPAIAGSSEIEFWLKGLFAFVPDRGGSGNFVAQPSFAGHGMHLLRFLIQKRVVESVTGNGWKEAGDYFEWTGEPMRSIYFPDARGRGAGGNPASGVNDLCPGGPLHDDAFWLDRRFIPKLSDLVSGLKLKREWLKSENVEFAMRLPMGGQWYPRAPRKSMHREWMWEYRSIEPTGKPKGGNPRHIRQAITDTVAFKAVFRRESARTIVLSGALPTPQNDPPDDDTVLATITLKADMNGRAWVRSFGPDRERDYEVGEGLGDFLLLYRLCTTDTGSALDVAPVRLRNECAGENHPDDPDDKPAKGLGVSGGDVFCAGGEVPDPGP